MKANFMGDWQRIIGLFPEDFQPDRAGALGRHLRFAYRQDFSDIERLDVPAVMNSVHRYGRKGDAFIAEEVERLSFDSLVSHMIHPQIADACAEFIAGRQHQEAVRITVELLMDELKRLSASESDGDTLVRSVVGVTPGKLAFSDCQTHSAKQVTEGLKLIAQGLYKGVRNPSSHGSPSSHGGDEFDRIEMFQIMAVSSLLLTRLQIVK